MKLYHWTAEKNLLGIAVRGLEPFKPYGAEFMTDDKPVVWLTRNKSREPSPADIEHFARTAIEDDKPQLLGRTLLFGDPGDVRLTVKFNSTNSRKLQHWHTWISQHKSISNTVPSGERDFYVHLGVIPAAQIELPPITARIGLLGLKADAPQRKQLETLPPDTLLDLDVAA